VRAYFLKDGRIRHVVELPGLSDAETIAKARSLFDEWGQTYDAFEVWEKSRRVEWHGRIGRPKPKRPLKRSS
jgi:hypothetical protein